MKEFDYSRVKDYKTAAVLRPSIIFLTRLLMRVRYEGLENIPAGGGYILASNHISAPDPAYIYVKVKTPIHFMNKKEHFKNPVMNWIYTHFNSFPINRGHSDKNAVEYAIKIIQHGDIFGIFPEGTRSKDFTPKQPKTGIALIARETKAGILPVCVYSANRAKLFTKITIRFGKMIPFSSLNFSEGGKSDELREVSQQIMDEIIKLWEKGHGK